MTTTVSPITDTTEGTLTWTTTLISTTSYVTTTEFNTGSLTTVLSTVPNTLFSTESSTPWRTTPDTSTEPSMCATDDFNELTYDVIDAWRRTDGKTGFIGILKIPQGISQFTLIFKLAESDENVQIDIWNADFFVEYGEYQGLKNLCWE